MTVWIIRGGSDGSLEDTFLGQGIVAIGFNLTESVANFADRDALRARLDRPRVAGQIWRFYQDVTIGDMVVLPRKLTREVAVGRIAGDYDFQPGVAPGHGHVRAVDWLFTNIPRANFANDQDLLRSRRTIQECHASDAEERILRIANDFMRDDPVEEPLPAPAPTPAPDPGSLEDDADQNAQPIEEIDFDQELRDGIIDRLREFHWARLEDLVASILKASGYHVQKTRQGADGGVDVLAGKGDLGFGEPRLCVQVKGRAGPIGLSDYDRLQGNITSYGAQYGLLVSLGGFTKPVHDRNEQSFFAIRLWGPEELAQQLLDNYDALPQDIRADIPLETVRILRQTPAEA